MKRIEKTGVLIAALVMLLMTLSTVSISAATVSISKKTAVMWVGDSLTLKMNGVAASKVKWKSGRTAYATVSSKGVVKAKKAGSSMITATVGKKKYYCKVTIKALPVISAKVATLRVGDKMTLKMKGVAASSVKWSTSRKTVATVTTKGAVSAKKIGSAVITATVGKKKFTCKLTVKVRPTTTVTEPSSSSGTASSNAGTVVDTATASGGLTSSTAGLSAEEARVYKIIYALRTQWPEGRRYTNDDYYRWNGGIYRGGYGCAGFVFMLSDAAFGDELAVMHYDFKKVKVGDIIRLDYNAHSVMVMRVTFDGVIVTEGNYNSSVHWGRYISFNEILRTGTHVLTRYGKSTLEQKAKVKAMRDSLPDLF